MKKITLASSLFTVGVLTTSVADAALLDGAVLNFDAGVVSSSANLVIAGSYFGMDRAGDGAINGTDKTAITMNDGLIVALFKMHRVVTSGPQVV